MNWITTVEIPMINFTNFPWQLTVALIIFNLLLVWYAMSIGPRL